MCRHPNFLFVTFNITVSRRSVEYKTPESTSIKVDRCDSVVPQVVSPAKQTSICRSKSICRCIRF